MQTLNQIPSAPGTYVLILKLQEKQRLLIGKLGEYEFPEGTYAYVGSAQGPGGLASRLKRHLNFSRSKPPHWHIDHLNHRAEVIQIWWQEGSPSRECGWAKTLSSIGERLIPNFGSSDCRCPGHLIWFPPSRKFAWSEYMEALGSNLSNMVILPQSKHTLAR
jgi:Uri superfamily endonuclease